MQFKSWNMEIVIRGNHIFYLLSLEMQDMSDHNNAGDEKLTLDVM